MTSLLRHPQRKMSSGLVRPTAALAAVAALVVVGGVSDVPLRGQILEAGEAQIYVAALRKDRPVMGLGVDDFRVEEDGDRREVLRVEPATIGFDLALLVDDSMIANSNITHIRDALVTFLEAMKGNRISLLSFGDERRTIVDYTTDLAPLLFAAEHFTGFSQTSAYLVDAVDETALELAARQVARPAMVVVTTEGRGQADLAIRGAGNFGNTGGRNTPDARRDRDAKAVVEKLWAYGVGMHAVALTTPQSSAGFPDPSRSTGLETITSGAGGFRWMQENRERERLLDKGPSDTGGRLYKVSSTSGVAERLQRIATELLGQYLVTYHRPAVDEVPRKLKVRVNGQRLTVRATPSRYYVPPATVYVVGGIVDGDTIYHHSIACEELAGGLVDAAVPVPLEAIGTRGKMCAYCPGARTHADADAADR